MASSSTSPHNYPLKERDEDEEDWLELGLGNNNTVIRQRNELRSNLGSTITRSDQSSPVVIPNSRSQLGLGLGFRNVGSTGMDVGVSSNDQNFPPLALSSHYYGLTWRRHHHDHDMSSSSTLTSSSWVWDMNDNMNGGDFLHRQNLLLSVPSRQHYHSRIRPESSGLWFSLRPSSTSYNNRVKKGAVLEACGENGINDDYGDHHHQQLPQIAKAYVRVKDEKDVTISMVKTYLVKKLGLADETQIDISCMGEKLLHSQTLKYVRDAVWLPRLFDSLKAIGSNDSNSTNYLMPLHYRRSCFYLGQT